MIKVSFSLICCLLFTSLASSQSQVQTITIGSKNFTESYILAEIAAQRIEKLGRYKVVRKFGLGGTGILMEAVESGSIDFYPEYSGTISTAILNTAERLSIEEINQRLKKTGLVTTKSLGFNNTYALAMKTSLAQKKGIQNISDLLDHPDLIAAFSHEFVKRQDGYLGLQRHYDLNLQSVNGIEHALAYEAIDSGKIELTDIYSTDAKIKSISLQILEDDKSFFPKYLAVYLTRIEFMTLHPDIWKALQGVEGQLQAETIIGLNAMADIEKKSFAEAARSFVSPDADVKEKISKYHRFYQRTKEHLILVFVALSISLLLGFPLGILATRNKWLGQIILTLSGLLQTIPSLALLCFLIPIFGIGQKPALVALTLYGLLPIVVNTFTGLQSVDHKYKEVARALGLNQLQSLFRIQIPLASPSILAGIKTSAIIGIGTATLAALIGAGGYGVPIMTGLALNKIEIILEGAIPAALLAIVTNIVLDLLSQRLIPKGLR